MVAVRLPEPLTESASFDLNSARVLGAAMLGVAAVRPLVPFEFVPPCPLRTLTGIPCPLCGMTRGVTAGVHADLGRAVFMNPGSIIAILLAVLVLLAWRSKRVEIPTWLIVAFFGLMWTWELFKYATGRAL
jgi:Protein of unknown function (DUF2752)